MKNSKYPIVAGILLILSGILIIFTTAIPYILLKSHITTILEEGTIYGPSTDVFQIFVIYGVIAIILAIFPILGGIMALKKKMYTVALAGGILGFILGFLTMSALFISSIFSLLGLLLVIISKDEFQQKQDVKKDSEKDAEKHVGIKNICSRKDISLIINALAGFANIFLFLSLFEKIFFIIRAGQYSTGSGEVLVGMIACGACFLIYIIFIAILTIFFTKIKKEHLFILMIINIIALFVLIIGNIIVRLI